MTISFEIDAIAAAVVERLSGPDHTKQRLFTIPQAAAYVGLTEPKMRNLVVQKRSIPRVRFGKSIYLDRRVLDEWKVKNAQTQPK